MQFREPKWKAGVDLRHLVTSGLASIVADFARLPAGSPQRLPGSRNKSTCNGAVLRTLTTCDTSTYRARGGGSEIANSSALVNEGVEVAELIGMDPNPPSVIVSTKVSATAWYWGNVLDAVGLILALIIYLLGLKK